MNITTQRGLNRTDFLTIQESPFWNDASDREIRMHKIHAYPAKFPSLIAKQAFAYAEKCKLELRTVADIFCGCGTVAVEAKRKGVDFWGCDINPVAVLIAEAKSKDYDIQIVRKLRDRIINYFEKSRLKPNYSKSNQRIQYWFDEQHYIDLQKLKKIILKQVADEDYKKLFLCIFSSILKGTSKWLTKSIKPQIDSDKTPPAVKKLFEKQAGVVIKAIEEADYSEVPSQVTIDRQNILEVEEEGFADMIVTSPPYVTSYEYADLHQLSALWLDYADDHTELRVDSIGSLYNVGKDNCPDGLTPTARKIVNYFEWNKTQTRSVARYYSDMQQFAIKAYSILRERGLAIFVIGDTEFRGHRIENAKCLCESMIQAGFTIKDITKRAVINKLLPSHRDENGKFTSDKSARSIYSQEYIIIGRKG